MERGRILDEIGKNGKVLRVRRDDMGLISEAFLFDPKDKTESAVDVHAATLLCNTDAVGNLHALGRLTARRNIGKLGYLDIGCPENGSEWYVLVQ